MKSTLFTTTLAGLALTLFVVATVPAQGREDGRRGERNIEKPNIERPDVAGPHEREGHGERGQHGPNRPEGPRHLKHDGPRGDRGPGFPGFSRLLLREELQEELGLSEEQVAEIEDIHRAAEEEKISLRSEIEVAGLDLRELMQADDADKQEILAAVAELGNLRTEMQLVETEAMLNVRDVLTEEQREQLRETVGERMRDRREKIGERMDRRRPGQGEEETVAEDQPERGRGDREGEREGDRERRRDRDQDDDRDRERER